MKLVRNASCDELIFQFWNVDVKVKLYVLCICNALKLCT